MREALTAVPRVGVETPGKAASFPVYEDLGQSFLAPKFGFMRDILLANPKQSMEPPIDPAFTLMFKGDLWPEQRKGVREALKHLKVDHGVFINGNCGSGKTVVGTYLMSVISGARTVVLVEQTEIAAQWAEQVRAHLPGASISFVMPLDSQRKICNQLGLPTEGRQRIDLSGRVVIVMAETMMREPLGPPIDAVLLIVDEAHSFAAEKFSRTIYHFSFRYSVALTATRTRPDGLEWVFQYHLGTNIAQLEGRRMPSTVIALDAPTETIKTDEHRMYFCTNFRRVTSSWKCMLTCRPTAPCPYLRGDGTKIDYSSIWSRVANDAGYNQWLTTLVKLLYDFGRQVIVFGKFKEHLTMLRQLAINAGIPEERTALYFGGMDKATSATPQITFATYGKVKKAVDIPHKDAAIFAIPIRDAQQPMGRIERRKEGKAQPVLLEPVLVNVEPLEKLFWAHCRYYKKGGYVVFRTDPQGARDWLAACHQDCVPRGSA